MRQAAERCPGPPADNVRGAPSRRSPAPTGEVMTYPKGGGGAGAAKVTSVGSERPQLHEVSGGGIPR